MTSTDAPDPILVGEEDEERLDHDCQVDGCDRPGTVRKRIAESGSDQLADRYVCSYHHRLFVGIKAAIAIVVVALFLLVLFEFV